MHDSLEPEQIGLVVSDYLVELCLVELIEHFQLLPSGRLSEVVGNASIFWKRS